MNDSTIENNVWKKNLSGCSSLGSNENSGCVADDGEASSVISWNAETGWESCREESDRKVDSMVEDELRDLDLVVSGQVHSIKSRVDWSKDGDWVSVKNVLSANGEVGVDVGESGKVGRHCIESNGESSKRWIENGIDDENFSIGCSGSCVDWISVDSEDGVVRRDIVVNTEWKWTKKRSEAGVKWERSCDDSLRNMVEESSVSRRICSLIELDVSDSKVVWSNDSVVG
jgi:uncharacterized protein YceK